MSFKNAKVPKMPDVGAASALIKLGAVIGIGLYAAGNSLYNVEGGHRAIVFNRLVGVKDKVYPEGTHIMIPWFERPVIYDFIHNMLPKRVVLHQTTWRIRQHVKRLVCQVHGDVGFHPHGSVELEVKHDWLVCQVHGDVGFHPHGSVELEFQVFKKHPLSIYFTVSKCYRICSQLNVTRPNTLLPSSLTFNHLNVLYIRVLSFSLHLNQPTPTSLSPLTIFGHCSGRNSTTTTSGASPPPPSFTKSSPLSFELSHALSISP
ncbi:Band 7 protein [Artemisia annua]|uniref:Prohibitin n=1 Tax=Artemisia annua TaxID=35608 RepID=A0A2U1L7U8_ARTAN|nr:Band 7 protein [Artemisia annua]